MHSNLRNQWVWGFTYSAETWNGRLAMISFSVIFLFELLNSRSIMMFLGF